MDCLQTWAFLDFYMHMCQIWDTCIYIRYTSIQKQSNPEHMLILSSLIFKQLSLYRTNKEMSKWDIVYEKKFNVESIDTIV